MKTITSIIRPVAVAVIVSIGVFAQAQQLGPQVRQKTFEKVWQVVNDKYFDATFGGVDWRTARQRYGLSVSAVKTDEEFYRLMKEMLGELKTSHLQILAPEMLARLKQAPATTGVAYREVDGQIVITRIMEQTPAAAANLRPGFVITKIDDTPVKTVSDIKDKINGPANTTLMLSYLDEKDFPHEVRLERVALNKDDKSKLGGVNFYAVFESKRLDGAIGYIRFSNFLEFLNPRISEALLSMADAPGIIIDLRGNSGGDDSVGLKLASHFFEKPTLLMITKTRKGDNLDYTTSGKKNPFPGKVVLLLDELSGSESEQFAAGMQESGRAVVIGKTSAGQDMDADLTELPDGSLLLYVLGQPRTPKGYIVEGRGVKPDIEVGLTRKELLAGRDSQLQAAIEYIGGRKP